MLVFCLVLVGGWILGGVLWFWVTLGHDDTKDRWVKMLKEGPWWCRPSLFVWYPWVVAGDSIRHSEKVGR